MSINNNNQNGNINNNNLNNNNSLDLFREYLIDLGPKSLFNLSRQFKLLCDNKEGTLNYNEFSEAFKSSNLNIPDNEIENLFQMIEIDNSNNIDYIEFLSELIGFCN